MGHPTSRTLTGAASPALDSSPGTFDFYPNWQPLNLRPGKGCGDKNHSHAREGDCKKLR